MATDAAKLQLEVDSKQIKTASGALSGLDAQGKKTERNTAKLSSTFKLFTGVLAAVGVGKLASDFISVNVQFEKLQANLATVTGSTKLAEAEFKNIQQLASELPFQVTELTQAFVSLRNFGLDASEESLRAFADTSAATGKSLQQFIEAVADAATFEFERLKEFGIKTKQEGDKVQFTFRGITTEVEKSADAVQNYLTELSKENFQGAAIEQAKGLAGAISNLGDEYDNLLKVIGDSGAADIVNDGLRRIARGLGVVADAIEETPTEKVKELEERLAELVKANFALNTSANDLSNRQRKIRDDRNREIQSLIAQRDAIYSKLDADREEIRLAKEKEKAQAAAVKSENELKAKEAADAKSRASLNQVSDQIGLDVERVQREFEERNNVIQLANTQLNLSEAEFNQLRIANARTLQEELNRIEQEGSDQRNMLLSASQETALAATGQLFGNLASIAKEGGKKQFDDYKNLASAQAAISAALAINNALAVPVVGPALAVSIGALAAVQIAKIQGQEYQPRALGGQMNAGGSYLVGERGPELITMGNKNANITPNSGMGGNSAPQYTIVNQISSNAEGMQAEIGKAMPFIRQSIRAELLSEARRGGSFSKAVGAR